MKRKTHSMLSPLVLSIIVLCLARGITLAQTNPTNSTRTIKSKVGKLAVIERSASAMVIKGRILSSQNEPLRSACVVALPVTSYAALSRYDKDGQFELPWSPTWLENGQSIYLIAKSDKNEAAFVKITDPLQPITIHLEPACTLEGKVVDPNGERLEKYTATLSLPIEFKCKAPVFKTTVGFPRERIFSTIPHGTKYTLTIEAEGYQSKEFTVDATDRSKKFVDVGTIILQPQDPGQSAEQKPNPDLAKEFRDIYRLDEGEVIKIIKPPYILGRQMYFPTMRSPMTLLGMSFWRGPMAGFHWDGKLECYVATSGHEIRLDTILRLIMQMPDYDFIIPEGLKISLKEADWIVRTESLLAEKLKALEEIIYAETNRVIHFEKRKIEREVVVATGRFEFKPPPTVPDSLYVNLTWDGTLSNPVESVKSLTELFNYLERVIKIKFVDETEPSEYGAICYRQSGNLAWIGDFEGVKKREALDTLLDNLSKTTSLKFIVEKQPAEMWFVTETTGK